VWAVYIGCGRVIYTTSRGCGRSKTCAGERMREVKNVCGRSKISTHGPPTRVRNPRRSNIFWKFLARVVENKCLRGTFSIPLFYGYCPVGSSQIRSDFGTSWPPNALIHGSDVRLRRRRSAVTTYSENQLVYDSNVHWEFLTIQERLEQLHRCVQLGFDSIFEASLEEAKTPPTGFHDTKQHMKEFAQNGQF
jgi:hypothetical protein